MAAVKMLQGDQSAAAWESDEIRALEPRFAAESWLESYPMTDGKQRDKILLALKPLGL